jgi:tRNA(Ile)-lysidine synthase
VAWVDLQQVNWPLEVRFFQPGDRFRPLGAPGPRKLQDFLVDCKIPRWLRSYLPLVADRKRIIWVAGLRTAQEVRLTPASRTVLQLEFAPTQADTRRLWELLLACAEFRVQSSKFKVL